MWTKVLVIGIAALAVASCAPIPTPAGPPAPTPEAEAAAPPTDPGEPEMKAIPPTDVRGMKCEVLNSASDDDKAYGATFLLGYRAGLLHAHTLDTKKIDAVEQAAMADCAANPKAMATRVFAAAEVKVEAALNPTPHHVHHRARGTPAAAPSPAAQQPMRYAPATENPVPAEPAPAEPSPPEAPPATPPGSPPSDQGTH